jgi:molybdenum cofactor synthesis domain-containing protein
MTTRIKVVSVNVSEHKGAIKRPVDRITVDEMGVVGDAHAGRWHRQVSLLDQESAERFSLQNGRTIQPGEFGENITFRGLPAREVAPLDRFAVGEVELEVTQIGKECHGSGCAIFRQVGKCVMPAEGLFARVVRGGTIRRGDEGEHRPRPLTCLVITLSDRASAGDYTDRSGPRIQELLQEFFATRRWRPAVESCLLPDDPEPLRLRIGRAKECGVDLIFTTGGTGVGPRDITPDTIAPLCDKLLPGIMEHIRAKCGRQHPRARLSRSLAGVAGKTQIYSLPGSVRAVEDYIPEILDTVEHLILMLHGLDVHG